MASFIPFCYLTFILVIYLNQISAKKVPSNKVILVMSICFLIMPPPCPEAFILPDGWEAPENIAKNFPFYISGRDFEGRPVAILEAGRWNFRNAVERGGKYLADLSKHVAYCLNLSRRLGSMNGTELSKLFPGAEEHDPIGMVGIVDVKDFDFFQIASPETLLYWTEIFRYFAEMHVEEFLAYGILINANAASQVIVNISRSFAGAFLEKLEIHGTNKERWIPILLKLIPKDQLPLWYGGSADFKPVAVYG